MQKTCLCKNYGKMCLQICGCHLRLVNLNYGELFYIELCCLKLLCKLPCFLQTPFEIRIEGMFFSHYWVIKSFGGWCNNIVCQISVHSKILISNKNHQQIKSITFFIYSPKDTEKMWGRQPKVPWENLSCANHFLHGWA